LPERGKNSSNDPGYAVISAIDRLVRAIALYCGGLVLMAVMGVTVVDVAFRYLINKPIGGSFDYSTVLLVLIVACAIPYGGRTGAHVTADLFTHLMGPTVDRIVGIVVKFCLVGLVGIWAWQLHLAGRSASRLGEATLLTDIPFEPFYQALALGVAIYAVVLLLEAILLAVTGFVPPHPDVAGSDGSPE